MNNNLKITILIIITIGLLAGVGYLGWQLVFRPVVKVNTNTNANANVNQPVVPAKSPEEQLSELNAKFGTMGYCDYFKDKSVDQYNSCVLNLAFKNKDAKLCDQLIGDKPKSDCKGAVK